MPYVNGVHKAGMHEASRIAQILLHREAEMAMAAAAGRRVHEANAHRLPPADAIHRTGDAPDERRDRDRDRREPGDDAHEGPDEPAGGHIDLSA